MDIKAMGDLMCLSNALLSYQGSRNLMKPHQEAQAEHARELRLRVEQELSDLYNFDMSKARNLALKCALKDTYESVGKREICHNGLLDALMDEKISEDFGHGENDYE